MFRSICRPMKNLFVFLFFLSAFLVVLFITGQSFNVHRANNIVFIDDNNSKKYIKSMIGNKSNLSTDVVHSLENNKPKNHQEHVTDYNITKLKLNYNTLNRNMVALIEKPKLKIIDKLKFVNYSSGTPLTEVLPGVPTRNLIVTTFRSGSTFTSEIFGSHPGTFNYYEPLYKLEGYHTSILKKVIKNLLECNIPEWYLEHIQKYKWVFPHNFILQDYCNRDKSLCLNSTFVESLCQQLPFISMKITRLRLRDVEHFIKDSSLNLNVVYLVRDPRGTMTSRHRAYWCMKSPICGNYSLLCDDLRDDYYTAVKFKKLYPKKFRVIRYEDLSLNPFGEVARLFDFLHLNFSDKTKNFLRDHTTVAEKIKNPYSTFRNSSSTPFLWRTETSYKIIEEIQGKCDFAVYAWGYLLARNVSHQKTFNPVLHPFKL